MESIMYRANRRPFGSDGAISLTIKFASLNSIEIWEPRLCSTNRASCPTPCISTFPPPDEGGASASLFAAAAIEGVIMMTARYVSFSSGKAFCHTINIESVSTRLFNNSHSGRRDFILSSRISERTCKSPVFAKAGVKQTMINKAASILFIDDLSFIPGRRGNQIGEQIREPHNKLF